MASRITVIVGAYLAACFAASLVLSIAFWLKFESSKDFFSLVPYVNLIPYVSVIPLLIGIYIALFALLPTLPGIIYAERASVRSSLYYCGGGALVGIVSYGLYALLLIWSAGTATGFFGGASLEDFGSVLLAVFGGPGLVGGLVYWLIAGRKAGVGKKPDVVDVAP